MPVDIRISRHDPHNVEIKTHFSVPESFTGQTDLFLFLPKNFHAASIRKDKLMEDFLSRSRLAVSVPVNIELSELRSELEALLAKIGDESSVELARRFAAHASEILRVLGKRQKQQLYRSAIEDVPRHFESIYRWVHEVRTSIAVNAVDNSLIKLLDEYLSYLFVKYLTDLKEFATKITGAQGESLQQTWRALELQEKEYWQNRGFGFVSSVGGYANEQHLVRLSHLKKFFQSKMFVEIEKGTTVDKLAEPFAAASAGCAALWMAFFQGNLTAHANLGLGGSAVLTSGVFAYIMKDRIKDWAKKYFMQQASNFFPDNRQKLLVEKQEIGKTKEWLRVLPRQNLDEAILKWRRRSSFSDLENELPEDVLHYRVERQVKAMALPGLGHQWAFQDVLRINLNRYLKGLDDPFKEVSTFDPVGQLTRNRCHRTYPITMVLVSRSAWGRGETSPAERHLIARVWLDKTGIDRVERLEHVT